MKTFAARLIPLTLLGFAASAHAGMISLNTIGAETWIPTSVAGQDAYFAQGIGHSTGTGNIDAFLRIQRSREETGYNTSVDSPPFDDKAGSFTKDVQIASMPVSTVNGLPYYVLTLDANQTQNEPAISLSALHIYVTSTPSQDTENHLGSGDLDLADATKVFDLGADNYIQLDTNIAPGSGQRDMIFAIPEALFDSFSSSDYFVLYAKFGNPSTTNDGFEEFGLTTESFNVPEPASIALLAVASAAFFRRAKR